MSEQKYLDESGLKKVIQYITNSQADWGYYYKVWYDKQCLKPTQYLIDALLEKGLVAQPMYIRQTDGIAEIPQDYLSRTFTPNFKTFANFLVYSNSTNSVGVSPLSLYQVSTGFTTAGIYNYADVTEWSPQNPGITNAGVALSCDVCGTKQPLFYIYGTFLRPYFPSITTSTDQYETKILGYTEFRPDNTGPIFSLLDPSEVCPISTNKEDLSMDGQYIQFADRSNYIILRKNLTTIPATRYHFGNNAPKLKKTTTMVITYKTATVEYVGTYSAGVYYEHDQAVVKALLANSIIASDWETNSTGTILISKDSNVEDFNITFKSALDTVSPFTWQKSATSIDKNILEQSAINTADAIYEIRYDFDLNEQTINLPDNCVLYFKGGTFNNGTLTLNDAYIDYKDKAFNHVTFSGNYRSVDNKLGYGAYLKLKDGSLIKSDSNFKDSYTSSEVVGIVCKTKDINLLIPATTLKTDVSFCNESSTCPDVSTISTADIATSYYDGYAATNLLKANLSADSNWAANLAYNTMLDDRHCWLPSMGELMNIVSLKDEITTILNKLGVTWNFNEIWSSALASLKDSTQYIQTVYGYSWKNQTYDSFNCQSAYTLLPVTTAEGSDYHTMIDYVTQSDILGIVQNNIN